MEQFDMWGDIVQPKQTSQKQQSSQQTQQPVEMSANDMVTKPVTANSSANHIAVKLNYAFEQSKVVYQRLADMKSHQDWTDERHNQLKQAVNAIEQRMASFIEAHNQDMNILRESLTALMSTMVDEEEQLSSPETEERIHGNEVDHRPFQGPVYAPKQQFGNLTDPGIEHEDGSEFDD